MLMAVLARDYVYGFIITPNGLKGVFTDKLPDEYLLCAEVNIIKDYSRVASLGTIVYDKPVMRLNVSSNYHTVCVIKASSRESLKRMLAYAEGYPCSIIENLGGKCDYSTGVCHLDGSVFFCSADVLTTSPTSSGCVPFLKYCLLQGMDSGAIECIKGRVYYHGKEVGECDKSPFTTIARLWAEGKIKAEDLIVYHNIFHFLCTFGRQGCVKS